MSNLEKASITAFSDEQKGYLLGFLAGASTSIQQGNSAPATDSAAPAEKPNVYGTPVDDLCREEVVKYEQNGLNCYDTILANAMRGEFPDGGDTFRYKFYGLFHVTPAQESFMMRARIPGCIITADQFRGFAEMATDWGGGYADITTRGNIQIREIQPANCVNVLNKLVDLGLTSRGAGADNVRNVTATPTSGFDRDELIDVLPLARLMHHTILNNRDLYGMPRKFNISFDSGGAISVCADTNDIAFYACTLPETTGDLEPGVYFRMQLCGITGHKQFASDCGVILREDECVPVASAILRVFIENGDRTNRKKARLKYLVDDWGVTKFLSEVEEKLPFPLRYIPETDCILQKPKTKHGHVGVYKQKDGLNYIGVVVPVGRMHPDNMHKLAAVAEKYGQSDMRLTAWQNIIIPHISDGDLEAAKAAIKEAGFQYHATAISGGLVACTGSFGCKYAQAETKSNAVNLGQYLDQRLELDQPINIHITGCPNSCAQHYIGDIGMQAVKVKLENGEKVDGFNIVLGGGVDDTQAIAKEVFKSVPVSDIPATTERILKNYQRHRSDQETFLDFTKRHSIEELTALFS